MNKININGYTRISKKKARNMFEKGDAIYLLPCKLSPANVWQAPYKAKREASYQLFDNLLAAFSFYNCNRDRGHEIFFYTREE